jgi:hypothetical protein
MLAHDKIAALLLPRRPERMTTEVVRLPSFLQCMSPFLALSGQSSRARVCPLLEASSTGRRNTLSLREKIDYGPISQRFRGGTRATEKIALWDSWLRRGSLKAIGRAFGKPSSLFIASWPQLLRRPVEITDQSGQRSTLARDGLSAYDPKRTSDTQRLMPQSLSRVAVSSTNMSGLLGGGASSGG